MRPLDSENPDPFYADLEKEMLEKIEREETIRDSRGEHVGILNCLHTTAAAAVRSAIRRRSAFLLSAAEISWASMR